MTMLFRKTRLKFYTYIFKKISLHMSVVSPRYLRKFKKKYNRKIHALLWKLSRKMVLLKNPKLYKALKIIDPQQDI